MALFKIKWQTQIAIVLILLGGGYAAYRANIPPFTTENKAALKKLLSFGGSSEDDLEDVMGSGNLYTNPINVNNPSVQLNTKGLQPPAVKGDPRIKQIFDSNVYKQLFLPYDRYPFLYDNNYLSATRDSASNVPYVNPEGITMNYRPPIRIGGGQTANNQYSSLWDQLYSSYGYYPPGGSYNTLYDSDYYDIDELINVGTDPYYEGLSFLATTQANDKKTNAFATQIANLRDQDAMMMYNAEKYKNSEKFKRDEYKRQGIKIGDSIKRSKRISII